MRVFAAGVFTESNTFTSIPTGLSDFSVQRRGAAVSVEHTGLDLSKIWGELARQKGCEFVFSLMARAQPGGVTVRAAYEQLRDEILKDLRDTMPVDVVLLMLHGAMAASGYEDCEKDIISCVRRVVGPSAVIGVELDLHCHLYRSKIESADIVVTYKEYPHVDIADRAREVFDLAISAKLGEIRPRMALFDCRMVGSYPTSRHPLRGFVEEMKAAEKRKGVLSVSFGHGFRFADVPYIGAKLLVVTDGDAVLAEQVAEEMGLRVYSLRREIGFDSLSVPMEQALTRALSSTKVPVVVADQSDNVGGGAPGDATYALQWLLDHRADASAIGIFYDPEVVKIAHKAGVGSVLRLRLGGKVGVASGNPIDIEVSIQAIRENYMLSWPQQSGPPAVFPAGDVVSLRCDGIDIVVSSRRCQCLSTAVFFDLGIDLCRKQLVICKSNQHFFNSFAPIAGEVIYMAAPGALTPDPRAIPYRRVDITSMYPWIDDPLGVTSRQSK